MFDVFSKHETKFRGIGARQRPNYYEMHQTNYKAVKIHDELHLSMMHGVWYAVQYCSLLEHLLFCNDTVLFPLVA